MRTTLTTFLLTLLSLLIGRAYSQTINETQLLEYYQNQKFLEAANYLRGAYIEPVTDITALSRLAYASQMAGKLSDAENYYQRLFNIDSTKLSVINSLAGINLRRSNYKKANDYYQRIIKVDSTNFYVYSQLARICTFTGDSIGYVKALVKANQLNPEDADVASDLSNDYVSHKKFNEAENVLNKAIAADSQNVVLLQSLLRLTHAQSKWPEAIKTGMQLLQLGDGSFPTSMKLGQAYYKVKNYTCCLEVLAAMPGIQQNETSFYYMGLSYKALKKYSKALDCLDKAVNDGISSGVATYYGEIAGTYQETQRFKKAEINYQKGLQFAERPLLLYSLATLYDSDLKDKAKAVKYYKKYLATNPPALQQVYVDYTKTRIGALTTAKN
ncbi:tetratricopeptide repeat protein [Mucilaginibacter terrae]|uniref:Tetratricopeptide (TPR) repeat protein n=1 Tax=Mucilaginibacter terrae TaxID=1955052 RepID=A0ABU3H135_9SPHI|nr:tetratricopeptide repeat protein [Mucilaginibacter terrae]MDT3405626.1 tetratricopeptide (TPR) repeat protein [Mucilaginibacter terrae]